MLSLSVKSQIGEGLRKFYRLQSKQFPFAVSLALNKTAQDVRMGEKAEMSRVFDRARQYTLNSLYIRPSTKTDLKAQIGFKDAFGKGGYTGRILHPEIQGGTRRYKSFERRLSESGLLPSGYFTTPAKTALVPLDAYGNIKPSYLVQVLSGLKAFNTAGFDANRTAASAKRGKGRQKEWFVILPGDRRVAGLGLPIGIYQRFGDGKSRMVIAYVRTPRYSKRFDFYRVANEIAARTFKINLKAAAQRAMDSQRV